MLLVGLYGVLLREGEAPVDQGCRGDRGGKGGKDGEEGEEWKKDGCRFHCLCVIRGMRMESVDLIVSFTSTLWFT